MAMTRTVDPGSFLRRHVRSLGVAALAALMVACTGEANPSGTSSPTATTTPSEDTQATSDGQEATVRLLWNDGYTPQMDQLISNFNAEFPNISIETTYTTGAETREILGTQLPAGTAPDIFQTSPGLGTTSTVGYAEAGHLVDLSGRPWIENALQLGLPYVSVGDGVYGYQLQLAFQGIIYNEAVFDGAGVTPPSTFSDLLSMCETLDAAGILPIAIPFSDLNVGANAGITIANSFVDAADPDWQNKRLQDEVTFAGTPAWEVALQRILDMDDAGCFGPDPLAVQNPQHAIDVANGVAASAFLGSDGVGGLLLPVNPDLEWGMFAPPGDTADQTHVTWYGGAGLSIYNQSPVLEAATTFVDFAARPEQTSQYAIGVGGVPPADANNNDWTAVPQVAGMGELFNAGQASFLHTFNWPASATDAFIRGIQGLLIGQKSIDEVLQDVDAGWDQ